MIARRFALMTLAWLGAVVGPLALWSAPAQALVSHKYLFQFNEVPASSGAAIPGPVTRPGAMAVDAGHVWTVEQVEGTRSYRVNKFSAETGAFLAQPLHTATEYLGLAVGHPGGQAEPELFVTEYPSNTVSVYSEAGVKQATWTGAGSPSKFNTFALFTVAADNSKSLSDWAAGDVYVPVGKEKVVDVFKPEVAGSFAEKYVTHLTGTCATPTACATEKFVEPRNIAVSGVNGDVLVQDGNAVDVFEPTILNEYAFVLRLTGTPSGLFKGASGVAADSGGDIYVIDNRGSGEPPVVDQFSPGGAYLGHIKETTAGPFPLGFLTSIAVDTTSSGPTSGDVYVSDFYQEAGANVTFVDAFGPSLVVPDVTTEGPTEVEPESATFNGTLNPAKAGAAKCWFVYGTAKSFGQEGKCANEVPEGESAVPVHVPVTGLQPDTAYFYRMQASNENGTNGGEPSQDQEFTTPGPGIHSESVSNVASTSATLEATIDPHNGPSSASHGAAESYYFQYSTAPLAGCEASPSSCTRAPVPPGSLGEGEADVEVAQHVQGLAEGTLYHYRVVAVSEPSAGQVEQFPGVEASFTTQTPSQFALPDGRRWELVSPPNKHGGLIQPTIRVQAAEDGSGIAYETNVPTEPEPMGYSGWQTALSERGAQGWSTRYLATPHDSATHQFFPEEYQLFSPNLSSALVYPNGGDETLLSPEASEPTPYVRRGALCDGPASTSECYVPLLTGKEGFADVPPGTRFGPTKDKYEGLQQVPVTFMGASPDLSHVVLWERAGVALTNAVNPQQELYEWSAGVPAGEALQMVSVMPASEGGGPAPTEPKNGLLIGEQLAVGMAVGGQSFTGVRNAVSQDGSRVVWAMGLSSNHRLYVRDTRRQETLRLDVPQPGGTGSGEPDAVFQYATPDGSKVFFTDSQMLTSESGGKEHLSDLYECDIFVEAGKLACRLTDLTPMRSGRSAEIRKTISAFSEDGSYMYFVADGVLSENKNSEGEGATLGDCATGSSSEACNLYEEHEGTVTFIARLSGADASDWGEIREGEQSNGYVTAYASPDGRYLTFMSLRALTGYDNRDAVSGKPDFEVYLYDAVTGRLACVSCNPTGARPVGVEGSEFSSFGRTATHSENVASVVTEGVEEDRFAANLPITYTGGGGENGPSALHRARVVFDNGRVFFNGSDALVPQDVNGNEDAYEYEPVGYTDSEGRVQCTASSATFSARSDGCTSLISSGTSPEESGFLDASASGNDVFFLTASRLVPQDLDTARDVYDAHVCSAAAPCFTPAASIPPCETGDACKGAPSPQPPIFGSPASATFSGPGNLTAQPPKPSARGLTRAQRMARALRACHAKRAARRRRACIRRARALYAKKRARGKAGRAARKARG